MGFCETVTERENAGTVRSGRSRGSDGVRRRGEKCLLDAALGPALATRAGVVG